MTNDQNDQEALWRGQFGEEYWRRNAAYDPRLEEKAWRTMMAPVPPSEWQTVLECGCNGGRNLATLRRLRPDLDVSLIEINGEAYRSAVAATQARLHFNGSILASDFPPGSFDLVFTCGVLIHVAPDDLLATCKKAVSYSRRYVLVAEYFNRTPISLEYRGEKDKLFKRDFGAFMIDSFPLECVSYGFLWGREYDAGGFDDITWWMFRKVDEAREGRGGAGGLGRG